MRQLLQSPRVFSGVSLVMGLSQPSFEYTEGSVVSGWTAWSRAAICSSSAVALFATPARSKMHLAQRVICWKGPCVSPHLLHLVGCSFVGMVVVALPLAHAAQRVMVIT